MSYSFIGSFKKKSTFLDFFVDRAANADYYSVIERFCGLMKEKAKSTQLGNWNKTLRPKKPSFFCY